MQQKQSKEQILWLLPLKHEGENDIFISSYPATFLCPLRYDHFLILSMLFLNSQLPLELWIIQNTNVNVETKK